MQSIDTAALINHLNAKWAGRNCPMCGGGPWEVQPLIFQVSAYVPYIQPNLPALPLCPVTCKNCGNTLFINAKSAGLVSDKPGFTLPLPTLPPLPGMPMIPPVPPITSLPPIPPVPPIPPATPIPQVQRPQKPGPIAPVTAPTQTGPVSNLGFPGKPEGLK